MIGFDSAFDRLIGAEGGYTNDPNDPGGETNWGISKRAYPNVNIANLTRSLAKDIYAVDFWNRINADQMPFPIAFQTFDFAVNSGIETALRYLQRAIGVADDGHFGPISQAAAKSASVTDTLLKLNAARLDYMTRLSGWPSFSRGWARRIAANLQYAAQDT